MLMHLAALEDHENHAVPGALGVLVSQRNRWK